MLGCEMVDRTSKSISMDELEEMAKPLVDMLNKKGDPYMFITVAQSGITLSRHEVVVPTKVPD